MCDLTLLVTSIAVVIFYKSWTKCSMHNFACICSKLGSYHALIRDGSHSGTDVCVVDWLSNMFVPWIPVAKIHNKLSFRRVCGKSITALLDY